MLAGADDWFQDLEQICYTTNPPPWHARVQARLQKLSQLPYHPFESAIVSSDRELPAYPQRRKRKSTFAWQIPMVLDISNMNSARLRRNQASDHGDGVLFLEFGVPSGPIYSRKSGAKDRGSMVGNRYLLCTSGYRGGARKGLDLIISGITLTKSPYFPSGSPSEEKEAYGGVLLRTLRDLNSEKIISGPSLLVDHILLPSRVEKISDLVQGHWGNDINAFKSPCPYRYFLNPEKLTANVRAQTVLGVLPHKELSGLKGKTLNTHMAEYQTGLDGKVKLEEFVDAPRKSNSSSPMKYMQLMGCIEDLKVAKRDDDDDGPRTK
ncbi:hypothetical protein IW262DRAFT_1291287 [Armillaria fumosa]|nr:hypothetical protein IW262DRAFT_1291287 [Armillaria fumosa]